jgi:hypothetical protein
MHRTRASAPLLILAGTLAVAACNPAAPAPTVAATASVPVATSSAVPPSASPTAATAPPASSATPTVAPSASATSSIAPSPSASGAAVTDAICDPYLPAAVIESVVGAVVMTEKGSTFPALDSSGRTDIVCNYGLATGKTLKFSVINDTNGTRTNGGSDYADSGSVTKLKITYAGTPVTDLGTYAYAAMIGTTPVVGWQTAKSGAYTVADLVELDGSTIDLMVQLAKLVHQPG